MVRYRNELLRSSKRYFIFFMLGILCLSLTQAFSSNNLFTPSECTQEFANYSDNDNFCEYANYSGIYYNMSTALSSTSINAIDGNWSSYWYEGSAESKYLIGNYSLPLKNFTSALLVGAVSSPANINTISIFNKTIPSECIEYNRNRISVGLYSQGSYGSAVSCLNATSGLYYGAYLSGSGRVYEEKIIWYFAEENYSIQNLTLMKNYSYTRSFKIPSTINYLTSARFNLTGLSYFNGNVSRIEVDSLALDSSTFGGIGHNGSTLFALDSGGDTVKWLNRTYGVGGTEFTASSLGLGTGITSNGTHFFIIDSTGDILRIYNSTGANKQNITLGSDSYEDIASNGSNLFLIGSTANKIYAFNFAGVNVYNISLTTNNGNPYGITIYNKTFYVHDDTTRYTYSYSASGTYLDNRSYLPLNSATADVNGMVTLNDDLFLIKDGGDTLYKFNWVSYPSNITLTLNGNTIYNYSNTLNTTVRTDNLINYFNSYLPSCNIVGGNCTAPIIFKSISSDGILRYSDILLSNDGFTEHDQNYSQSAYEMSNQNYYINVSYDVNSYPGIDATLIYKGDRYTATKIDSGSLGVRFYRNLDVPIGIGTNNFYWEIGLTNTTGTYYFNSTTYTQTILDTNIAYCNTTTNVTYVNFTLYNSEDFTKMINGTFYINLNYWTGSGLTKKNFTYSNSSNALSSFRFCGTPSYLNLTVDADIQFSAPLYSQNYHYYRDVILSNVTTEQPLYLLNSSKSTITGIQIVDNYQVGQADKLIQIQKYDVGTGAYYLVGMAKTNYDGSDFVYLNWYDTFYKFIGVDESGNVLFNYAPYKIGESPQIFKLGNNFQFTYSKFLNMQYTFYYNNVTENVVLTFLDPSGSITSGCLKIVRPSAFNYRTVYDQCLSGTSGTITYNMGNESGNFVATFYSTGSFGDIFSIQFMKEIEDEIYNTLDKKDSAVYAFLIVGGSVFLGLFSPVVAIILGLGGWLFAAAFGFIKLDMTESVAFIGVALIGIYLAWKLRN